ncbi:hypothetical protein H072_56 [Dactylellina haptotyla CBS 200.50]|uniref:Uncharacterized protein n=1 Tax=Dactylellina haptotyla (strain CBS 200.50) TaxID=1284197 RepID=S8ASX0_DACHA|nr:hypothetical protein H072_56 [Dactylellina haptotyla CBS 200.50]
MENPQDPGGNPQLFQFKKDGVREPWSPPNSPRLQTSEPVTEHFNPWTSGIRTSSEISKNCANPSTTATIRPSLFGTHLQVPFSSPGGRLSGEKRYAHSDTGSTSPSKLERSLFGASTSPHSFFGSASAPTSPANMGKCASKIKDCLCYRNPLSPHSSFTSTQESIENTAHLPRRMPAPTPVPGARLAQGTPAELYSDMRRARRGFGSPQAGRGRGNRSNHQSARRRPLEDDEDVNPLATSTPSGLLQSPQSPYAAVSTPGTPCPKPRPRADRSRRPADPGTGSPFLVSSTAAPSPASGISRPESAPPENRGVRFPKSPNRAINSPRRSRANPGPYIHGAGANSGAPGRSDCDSTDQFYLAPYQSAIGVAGERGAGTRDWTQDPEYQAELRQREKERKAALRNLCGGEPKIGVIDIKKKKN